MMALAAPAAAGALAEDFFPIMPWDGLQGWELPVKGFQHPLESVAACNFTVAGFVEAKDLPVCKRVSLKAIIAPPQLEPWKKKWLGVQLDAVDGEVGAWVQTTREEPEVLGYYIMDEPGTSRFAALAEAVRAVKTHAPGKLAYINLFPGYATIGAPDQSQLGAASFTEYLERFVREVQPQFLSYDNYRIFISDNLQNRDLGGVYFTDLMEVRRIAQKSGLPFWNTACSNRIRPWTTAPSPANLMLQAYTTLAAGARGLAWYTYHQRGYDYAPIDKAGARTDTWFYLQMVNRQVKTLGPLMNRMDSTGVFFTRPAPADGLPPLPGRLVRSVVSRASLSGFSEEAPALMIGEFRAKDGSDYAMIVNLSLEKSANIAPQWTEKDRSAEVISAVDGSLKALDTENGYWLAPGQGALLRLQESQAR